MHLAGDTVDNLGRGTDEDAHRQDRALLDDHAFDNFGTGADETVILDDHRAGLERLENTADTRTGDEYIASGGTSGNLANNAFAYLRPDAAVAPIETAVSINGYYIRHRDSQLINCGFLEGHVESISVNTFMDWKNKRTGEHKMHFSPNY